MQENLYKKIKNGIKKSAYKVVGVGIVSFVLATGVFAQEGTTIDNKINEKPNPTKISDEIKEEPEYPKEISDKIEKEPEYFKKTSDKINESFQETLANYTEIGGEPARKETIDGQEYYFIEGFDYAFLKLKLGNNILPIPTASVNYAIEQGFNEAVSIMGYNPKEMNFFNNAVETEGKDKYVYVKTNIKDTKSSKQNKEE